MTLRQMAFGMICLMATAPTVSADEMLVTVAGDITVNGKALATGRIFFFLEDDQFVGSKIKDGAYKVVRVPVGACRVEFEGEGVSKKPVFKVNITPGNNVLDFDMKSR